MAPRCVRGPSCSPDSWLCARSGWQLVSCHMLTTHAWAADPGGLVALLCGCSIRRTRRARCLWPSVPGPVCLAERAGQEHWRRLEREGDLHSFQGHPQSEGQG